MQRRATMERSLRSLTRATMNSSIIFLMCSVVGGALGFYANREAPYNIGPNDPYSIEVSPYFLQEPSQRLFFGSGQGSNQVGGQGLWATLTNKFPFLQNMFGRMELSPQYGAPNQGLSTQYGVPGPQVHTQYGVPARFQPQFYQAPPFIQRSPQFFPAVRDVAFTDDAVIVTPPHVPIAPPQPEPAPEPAPGYQYNKPQYRLELPHK